MKTCRLWSLYAARRHALRVGDKAKAAAIHALILRRVRAMGAT